MNASIDMMTVVREALRAHAFSNTGNLPPTRLNTLGVQISQFLQADQPIGAHALGRTLQQQGIGLRSISAVLVAVQTAFLQKNDSAGVIETAQRVTSIIEGYIEQQMTYVRMEQERFRQALNRIAQ